MTAAPPAEFLVHPYRLRFRCLEHVRFPRGKAGNAVRGALGVLLREAACTAECRRDYPDARNCPQRRTCEYVRLFEPAQLHGGPSGFADPPRPFVIRAAHLDGYSLAAGAGFHIDLHLFDACDPPIELTTRAFAGLKDAGIGVGRGRAELESVEALDEEARPRACSAKPLRLILAPGPSPVDAVTVDFVTPTELKNAVELHGPPSFATLFSRLRDRIAALARLYGQGALEVDFRGLGERAARVSTGASLLQQVVQERRSSRTGRIHPIGGFIGRVEYNGALTEFLPWLRAGYWTGVGRQTVWGKGAIRVLPWPDDR